MAGRAPPRGLSRSWARGANRGRRRCRAVELEGLQHLAAQLVRLERFQDVVVDAELDCAGDDRSFGLAGEHDHRRPVSLLAELREHRRPVHHRHRHVEQDQIDRALVDLDEPLLSVLGVVDLEAELDHLLGDDGANGAGVVDGQDARHGFTFGRVEDTERTSWIGWLTRRRWIHEFAGTASSRTRRSGRHPPWRAVARTSRRVNRPLDGNDKVRARRIVCAALDAEIPRPPPCASDGRAQPAAVPRDSATISGSPRGSVRTVLR